MSDLFSGGGGWGGLRTDKQQANFKQRGQIRPDLCNCQISSPCPQIQIHAGIGTDFFPSPAPATNIGGTGARLQSSPSGKKQTETHARTFKPYTRN